MPARRPRHGVPRGGESAPAIAAPIRAAVQYLSQSDVSTACPVRASEEGNDEQGARRHECTRAGGTPRQDTVDGAGGRCRRRPRRESWRGCGRRPPVTQRAWRVRLRLPRRWKAPAVSTLRPPRNDSRPLAGRGYTNATGQRMQLTIRPGAPLHSLERGSRGRRNATPVVHDKSVRYLRTPAPTAIMSEQPSPVLHGVTTSTGEDWEVGT